MSIRGGSLPRLAMACWGDDWLTRSDVLQGEYRSLPRVLDELQERGYNALRVDAFPHLVASPREGVVSERFQIPGAPSPWIQPRKSLIELAKLAQARDLRLWLTSRYLNDSQARRSFIRRPRDYIDTWSQTLTLLGEQGLLDTVVAVDFCHEFTSPETTHGPWRSLFGGHPRNPLNRLIDWSRESELAVEGYLLEVPRVLRASFPTVAFGVSVSGQAGRRISKLDTTELDFLDAHLWLDDDPRVSLLSGSALRLSSTTLARRLQTRVAGLAWRARGTFWLERLEERLEGLGEFSRLRRLQPVLGGGYVHLPEHPADWTWVQQVSESIIKVSLSQGFNAVLTAHQARPQYTGLWRDIDWHRDMTGLILKGRRG